MSEEALVHAAAGGDRDAFASLAAPRMDRMYATATLILRDRARAEDAVQDALVRAWRDLPRLREPGRLDAWLRRLLVNACRDLSRRGRRHEANIRLLPDHDRAVAADTDAVADRETVVQALATLPLDQRVVVVHHYYLGLPLPEVAETLGIPLGTVKSRLHYARRAMRSAIEAGPNGARSEGHVA